MRTYFALVVTSWWMAGWTALAAPVAFTRGNVHTGAVALPHVSAVLVDAGRIPRVGRDAEVRSRMPATAREIDLRGHTLLPGFVDAHVHLAGIGSRDVVWEEK